MDEILALAEEVAAASTDEAVKRLAQWAQAIVPHLEELREYLDRDDLSTKGLVRIVDDLLSTAAS